MDELLKFLIPLPPLPEQQRIAARLREQIQAVDEARQAAEAQLKAAEQYIAACLLDSLKSAKVDIKLSECLSEVNKGIGEKWDSYQVIGATRSGTAPAKDKVGKNPERYKLVDEGTIFYNPMRILIGSIGMIDEKQESGITSPDYVVFKTKENILHHRWFYYWLRSCYGEAFIKTLARGAVRERMLFNRLSPASIAIPPYEIQEKVAGKFKIVACLKENITDQLYAINQLPAALLRQAFSGTL